MWLISMNGAEIPIPGRTPGDGVSGKLLYQGVTCRHHFWISDIKLRNLGV